MTHKIFWLFTAAVFVGLLVPALVQEGMFLDGVTYACIAKNMANGLGSLTRPYYTATLYPAFYEQPPLALWLQSQFFRSFGDHFWVERLYSFCMALLSAVGIVMIWRLLSKQTQDTPLESKKLSWLPVLLWITAPIIFWGFQNNMLECTMSVFVLLSAYCATKSIAENKVWLIAIAALLTVAAVLCKGPVGFFPIAAPLAFGIAFDQKRVLASAGRSFLMFLLTFALLGVFILFVPGMQEYFDYYLDKQLLPTLSGAREKQVANPLSFLLDLFSQLAIPSILLACIFARQGFRRIAFPRQALFFFALGLAGTLPLVFTPKQSAHYLLPSIPFFALGFASVFSTSINFTAISSKRNAILEKIAWIILAITIVISLSFWGKYRRDRQKISDVTAICNLVGQDAILSVPQHFSEDWLLIACFGRLNNVSLDTRVAHDFWLIEKNGQLPQGYGEIDLGLVGYKILKKF